MGNHARAPPFSRIMRYLLLLPLVIIAARQLFLLLNNQSISHQDDKFVYDEGVLVLKSDNFQRALDSFENILVQFYEPSCDHCKTFAPVYVKIATVLKERGEDFICAKVNAKHENELIEKYGIKGFPALRLFRKDKKPDPLDGTTSVESVVRWVTEKLNPVDITQDKPSALERATILQVLEKYSYLNQFNRNMLLPLIKSIVVMDYFRYVRVNLDRPCTLWCNADKCNLRDCHVKTLSDPEKCPLSTYDDNNELATVNTELASDQLGLLIKLFECNDNDDHDSKYVDLLINPERYTGYSGESAHRIWRAIYEENCFVSRRHNPFQQDLCYEERLFYEAISGLHSSINIHLCAEYPSNAMIGLFEPNVDEFRRRFENHDDYIENLYRLFLLELRALATSKPYLLEHVSWPDESTKNAIQDLFTVIDKFKVPVIRDFALKPSYISHELALHFHNITTTIIDCVACDKCKLWGKVQLRGLGTAFKVLSIKDLDKLHLNQQEVVSLVNAVARLSHSIRNLEQFRDLLVKSELSGHGTKLPGDNVIRNNPLNLKGQVNPFKF